MIERANHVWCADITYIPVRRGFLYLVAIMDWASRHVLAWRLSNTLDAGFCTDALDEALARHGTPDIFNTDQGAASSPAAPSPGACGRAGIRISMDGRGRCLDNIFIERLWRSLKYEAVYRRELADGVEARRVIGEWIDCYNTERPHSAPARRHRRRRRVLFRPMDSRHSFGRGFLESRTPRRCGGRTRRAAADVRSRVSRAEGRLTERHAPQGFTMIGPLMCATYPSDSSSSRHTA